MQSLRNLGVPLLGVLRLRSWSCADLGFGSVSAKLAWWSPPMDEEEDDHDYVFCLFNSRPNFLWYSFIMLQINFMSFVLFLSSLGVPLP